MRVGLFGGSFDPVHRGHIEPVLDARSAIGLDLVYYLPTARPPHKGERQAAPWARFAMVELALLDHQDLLVSTHELVLDRPAYTVETVEHFRRQLPDADLYLLLGADAYGELQLWRRWRDLLALTRLVVLVRPGFSALHADLPAELRTPDGERIVLLENPGQDLSSTQIREALGRGEDPPSGALPAAVLHYCRKYSLYR